MFCLYWLEFIRVFLCLLFWLPKMCSSRTQLSVIYLSILTYISHLQWGWCWPLKQVLPAILLDIPFFVTSQHLPQLPIYIITCSLLFNVCLSLYNETSTWEEIYLGSPLPTVLRPVLVQCLTHRWNSFTYLLYEGTNKQTELGRQQELKRSNEEMFTHLPH